MMSLHLFQMGFPCWSAAKHCLKLSTDLNLSFILYVGKVSQVTYPLWDLMHSSKMAWPYSPMCRIRPCSGWCFTPTAALSCILPNTLQAAGKWNLAVYLQPSPQVFLYKCSKQLVAQTLFPGRRRHLNFFWYSELCQGSWNFISRTRDWLSWNIFYMGR